jgi:hypothetical protein
MNGLRKYWQPLALVVVLLGSVWATAPATQAAAQETRAATPPPLTTLVAIRAAHHAEATPRFDRVVFEFNGPVPLFELQYVNRLIGDASGLPVAITGPAILQLRMSPAQAHNEQGQATAPGRVAVRMPIVKEVVRSGDFEAVLTYGIGATRKSEIRVITLADPSRIVVDVLHR